MVQQIKDYMKSAVRNKFTLGGYVSLASFLLIKHIEHETGFQAPLIVYDVLFSTSFIGLGTSLFGGGTYIGYTRMREHIKEYGTIDTRFEDKLSYDYCTRTGIEMAAEEAGLEHLI